MPLFDDWTSLGHTALKAVLAYAALVTFLRISGKRTLSKMNAFDFVVTVALGSTLASILTSRQTPLADGALALLLLIALQFVVATLAVHVRPFQRLIKSEPRLLFRDGQFLDRSLRQERVTREEVLAAIRGAGVADAASVHAVVLETDGSFSVLRDAADSPRRSSAAPLAETGAGASYGEATPAVRE